jgi:hypothetical protein
MLQKSMYLRREPDLGQGPAATFISVHNLFQASRHKDSTHSNSYEFMRERMLSSQGMQLDQFWIPWFGLASQICSLKPP